MPGEGVTYEGNIGTAVVRTVVVQKEYKGTWYSYDTAQSSAAGDYSVEVSNAATSPRTFRILAPAENGQDAVTSDTFAVVTVLPDAPTTSDPAPAPGEEVTYTGNIGMSKARTVTVQKEYNGTWYSYGTAQSAADGGYSVSVSSTATTPRTFRILVAADGALPAYPSKTFEFVTVVPKLDFDLQRDCTGNDCAATATATGATTDPVQVGRVFKLQYLNGSTWTQLGSSATSDADGKVEIGFSLAGLSQWSTRSYRLTSSDAPALTSHTILFMPGPTQLGKNVLRVDVDKGVFPTSKGPEYAGDATLSVEGVTTNFDNVPLENFGVRGTSTATYAKRAYKLKFLDKPPSDTTVFGMKRAKSWSLLANWLDRSNVRDKVGLELGRKMAPKNIRWTPDSRYVELFVNDQYRGAYLMTESVKIDGDRVDIDESQGMIMETEGHTVDSSLLGFKSSKGIAFAFKDPDERKDGGADPTGVTTAKLNAIRTKVNAFESKLYSATTREQYPNFIDVNSAIDFYLVKEFTKDRDADFFRSNYFSWDPSGRTGKPLSDGKFHFGPAWDFDRSAGITSENDTIHNYVQSPAGFYVRGTGIDNDHPNYKTHWFVQLFKSQSFRDRVDARWLEVRDTFAHASDEARAAAEAVGVGAENDRKRWVGPRRYAARGSYQDEIDYVANWYDQRYAWMNANL